MNKVLQLGEMGSFPTQGAEDCSPAALTGPSL